MGSRLLSNEEISGFCLEMSYLIHAGIRSSQAMHLIAEDAKGSDLEEIYRGMAEKMDEGAYLSEVVSGSGCFAEHVGKLLAVGEETGRTEEALESIASTYEHRAALDRRINSALLYPSILLVIMLAVIAVLLVYVLPIFNDVYAQLGGKLTGVAEFLLKAGNVLRKILPLLAVILGVPVVLMVLFASSRQVRSRMILAWQKIRGDKGVSAKIGGARYAQALALGMSSGMPIEDALLMAAEMLPDHPSLKEKADDAVKRIRDGEQSLSSALADSGILSAARCRMLEAGIRGGASEKAMEQIAESMSDESETALEELVAKVEPTMVVITSVLVALILLSVMMPLINIMSSIG